MSKNASNTEEKTNKSTIEGDGSMQDSFDSNDTYYEAGLKSFVNSLFDGFQMRNILQKCFKEEFDESSEPLASKIVSIEEKLQDKLPSLILNEFKKEDFFKHFTVLEEIDENYASGISEAELSKCKKNSKISFLNEIKEKLENEQRNLQSILFSKMKNLENQRSQRNDELYTELQKGEQLQKELESLKAFLSQDDFQDGTDIG